jgi:DNA polymerase III delta prime subunit
MFENIIGQSTIIQSLSRQIKERRLPSAVLFYGPAFSAKLSTALETARVLTCEQGGGEWGCTCAACRSQRVLSYPNMLLLGSRYFDIEIAACADVLRRTGKLAARYLFIRAVRKLTRRFDPVIWEGDEARLRRLVPTITEIEERLDMFSPEREIDTVARLEDQLAKIIALCRKLIPSISAENIPINHIRRASYWMHMSPGAGGDRKIVIMENADRMHDPSGNSLLKILEEPPGDVTVLLLATRREGILPTVQSRLRPYFFPLRPPAQTAELLQRVFHEEDPQFASLNDYFLSWRELNPDQLKNLARRFVEAVLQEEDEESLLADLKLHLESKQPRDFLDAFFHELSGLLHTLLSRDLIRAQRLAAWNQALRDHFDAFSRFNQNPQLALESLYYQLRARK